MARARREPIPNAILYNLRDSRGETQEQVAEALNALARTRNEATAFAGNHISRWERGIVHPGRLASQLLAEHFGVSIVELGLARPKPVLPPRPAGMFGSVANFLPVEDDREESEPRVKQSQQEWLSVRKAMHRNHTRLARAAAQLYPDEYRLSSTGVLAKPGWMLPAPIDLAEITLELETTATPPKLDGTGEVTSHVRPLHTIDQRYQRYSQAIRDVAQPRLFENRLSWRLLRAEFEANSGHLAFGQMNYFDAMDTCEALAHEFSATHLANDDQLLPVTWRGLKFRKAVGDPFDLDQRPLLMSINTLTIRRDKTSASVVLHNRNAASVATSGGVIGVMPAGVFQPSSVRVGGHSDDFDLWRNIMREYSEEFLGNPEHDGDGPGADYSQEPLRSLDLARQAGSIRVYCLGLGIGALDLWGGLETVAVIDAEAFDHLFAALVRVNDEGTVLRVGAAAPTVHIPFAREVIDELLASQRLAPETALSLESAWTHREMLLGTGQ